MFVFPFFSNLHLLPAWRLTGMFKMKTKMKMKKHASWGRRRSLHARGYGEKCFCALEFSAKI